MKTFLTIMLAWAVLMVLALINSCSVHKPSNNSLNYNNYWSADSTVNYIEDIKEFI
jgi:hypothetical protein